MSLIGVMRVPDRFCTCVNKEQTNGAPVKLTSCTAKVSF